MARYIDADELLSKLSDDLPYKASVKRVLMQAPTADVVPKSEVDSEIKVWQELYADTVSKWEEAYEELEINLKTQKAEVAREIFEEIECAFSPVFVYNGYTVKEYLAELKKKYTGATNG